MSLWHLVLQIQHAQVGVSGSIAASDVYLDLASYPVHTRFLT
jgi:hypothetical protein